MLEKGRELTCLIPARSGQGAAVALLGLVEVSYSSSAELSLWASMRSDRVTERAATSNVAMNVRDTYQRAKFELDGLPAARPSAELQSLIDGLLIDPRAGGCAEINGIRSQESPQGRRLESRWHFQLSALTLRRST
jgi:hypothetical protein